MVFAVVDSSFMLLWGLKEEGHERCAELLMELNRRGGLAPAHWGTEVAEGLRKAVARKRVTAEEAPVIAASTLKLGVVADGDTWRRAGTATLGLARERGLSVYDAAYVELARRAGLPLLTLDAKMRTAARDVDVFVLPQE